MLDDAVLIELLTHSCPSIKYRIRREILGEDIHNQIMRSLQDLIFKDPLVKEVVSWQQPDGWLGRNFHGEKGVETGIRILVEKGVQNDHPLIEKALTAIEKNPDYLVRGIGKVGQIADDRNLGGSKLIRAVIFAYAGVEEHPFVTAQIPLALDAFKAVLEVNDITDISEIYRGKWIFRPGVIWPCVYHLRLLALTHRWRVQENRIMITNALQRLVDISPLPDIYIRHKSQLIAPASYSMHQLNPDISQMKSIDWMMWFQRMELFARLGIINAIPQVQQQITEIQQFFSEGKFKLHLDSKCFRNWGSYSGIMLEENWRSSKRREYDLTFRSKLIDYYTHAMESSWKKFNLPPLSGV